MNKPEEMPEAVIQSIENWSIFHNQSIPEIFWCNGYYGFFANSMFHGVELDGYIHT